MNVVFIDIEGVLMGNIAANSMYTGVIDRIMNLVQSPCDEVRFFSFALWDDDDLDKWSKNFVVDELRQKFGDIINLDETLTVKDMTKAFNRIRLTNYDHYELLALHSKSSMFIELLLSGDLVDLSQPNQIQFIDDTVKNMTITIDETAAKLINFDGGIDERFYDGTTKKRHSVRTFRF